MKKICLLFSFIGLFTHLFSQNKKLLIIGLDGCRADVVNHRYAPTMDSIIHLKNTAYSYKMRNERRTMSATNWSSLLTGVHFSKHKAKNNRKFYKGDFVNYPPFMKYLKDENPELKCASYSTWGDINKYIMLDYLDDITNANKDLADSVVENKVLSMLKLPEVYDATFVHLEDIDHNGHLKGFSKNNATYTDAVTRKDSFVKEILSIVQERKIKYIEDWLVIITTDHGGRRIGRASGHSFGMINPNIRQNFLIMNGDSVNSGKIIAPRTIDIAYSILTFFGVKIKPEWNLQGKTIGLKD
ncbi:MAG: alkaline phosphatase family protein [Chitinophagales bacterium]|nr:alkaline phosphatase family protein [Bacteroidota bacterium]MCB9075546.1 alkaline phosphatase family protein [Chitinophagales bacterium]